MIEPNPHLKNIQRVDERMSERANFVCLDRNERVSPCTDEIFQDMQRTLTPGLLSHYPDTTPLYARLSRLHSVSEKNLYATPGSDAAVRMLFQTYTRPGDRIVIADPTYAMYALYARIFQAVPSVVDYGTDLRLDKKRLLDRVAEKPRLLVLANPDQPTGATLPVEILRELAKATQKIGALFVIDEAYQPFYPVSALDLTREFDHVVITRTFSKAYGLAGLRLGYAIGHPSIIENIAKARGAHEVNAMAVAFGSYMLDHPQLEADHRTELEAGRRVLLETAQKLGAECPPCPTNFQLLRFPQFDSTDSLLAGLRKNGFLVKGGFTHPSVRQCLRVTLAEPEIMRRFGVALQSALQGL